MIVPGEEVLLLSSRAQGLSGKGGGGGVVGWNWYMHKPTYMSPDSDSDFFEPLFLGLIYCFSDISLKLMLQHT